MLRSWSWAAISELILSIVFSAVLPDLAYEDSRDSNNIVARINLPNMRYRPDQRIEVYACAVRGLRQLESEPEKVSKYLDFIDVYTYLDDEERKIYYRDYPEEAEFMSTLGQTAYNSLSRL